MSSAPREPRSSGVVPDSRDTEQSEPVRPAGRVTINHVAKAAGVSPSAVSIALNGRPGVSDKVRERVLAIADQMQWQPNQQARGLAGARASTLGLIFNRDADLLGSDPFFPLFLAGVERVLEVRQYALTIQVTRASREARSYERLAQSRQVDGVFLLDMCRDDPRPLLAKRLALPALGIGHPVGSCPIPWLAPDDTTPIVDAVRHLVSEGHTRIAHVSGGPAFVHSVRRAKAWREALHAAGLPPSPLAVGDFTGAGGARATLELLQAADPPTAIVYANDLMAISGIAAAGELGLSVPADLSVVGFGDIPVAAFVGSGLTTIAENATAWGEAAATTLLALIDGTAADGAPLPASTLIRRGSTGPAPSRRQGATRTQVVS